jgi:hypothetical protein
VIPVGAPVAVDSGAADWRNVLLDPLAGVPVSEAVAVNVSALGAELDTFFARLADLGPEWSGEGDWGEDLCVAVGAVLLGGAYFARTAPARPAPRRAPVGGRAVLPPSPDASADR